MPDYITVIPKKDRPSDHAIVPVTHSPPEEQIYYGQPIRMQRTEPEPQPQEGMGSKLLNFLTDPRVRMIGRVIENRVEVFNDNISSQGTQSTRPPSDPFGAGEVLKGVVRKTPNNDSFGAGKLKPNTKKNPFGMRRV